MNVTNTTITNNNNNVHPEAVRCDMVSHRALRARRVCEKISIGGEVRRGVTSGISRETSLSKY